VSALDTLFHADELLDSSLTLRSCVAADLAEFNLQFDEIKISNEIACEYECTIENANENRKFIPILI